MPKPRVFVTRIIPDKGLEMIHEVADAEIWPGELPPPYSVLLEKVRGLDGLVCLLTDQIDGNLMDAAGDNLKVISQMAVGFDNVDIQAATARNIPVGNTPGVLTDTTADFAFTLLMAAARRVVEGERFVKEGKWKTWGPTLLMGHEIHGATLGLIGFGRIGKAMARRAAGFNMRILCYDPQIDGAAAKTLGVENCSFEEVLVKADFLSLHVPLNEDTYHLMGEEEFKMMKPSSVLINSARGPVVDPKSLYTALNGGLISYAALDVTEPEPITMDDPLLTLENCLIVPHIASSSIATRTKMATMAAANLAAGLKNERLPNCANPGVYER
ncbi:MAG TPA: D-glycerate dehydrogenase [candidate division Zixibacteria bacterium]|nr:D-glycerate dehydrogenase [candidate division Zixibacteria bacterium]